MNAYAQIVDLIDARSPFCVAAVLSAEGSTPREAGVRAIVEETGRIRGTLGGGVVEARAQGAAIEACRSGTAAVLDLELEGGSVGEHEPICGGRMRILVDPTAPKDRAAYAAAAAALSARRSGVVLTTVRSGDTVDTQVSWGPEEEVATAEELGALADGNARLLPVDRTAEVLVEPVIPNPLLIIAGGGHVGQALAAQAVLIGFDVTVIDDRPEFTDPGLFPQGVTTRCGDIAEALAACPMGEDTYIVIVTRGHQHDAEALKACIHAPAAYVGMIGSRRKVALIRESFIQAGIATEEELDAVYAPIGLDIGAETVPEIAASIVAQLIAVRRKGRADRRPKDMRER